MKRRCGFILLVLCTLLLFSGCGSGKETVELPQTLQIMAELPEDYPQEVTAYNLSWYKTDENTAIDTFMHTDPQEREEQATGPIFRTYTEDFSEHLHIYEGVVHGGMDYSYYSPGGADFDSVADTNEERYTLMYYLRRQQPWECINADLTPRERGNGSMGEAGQEDLDFMSYDDALRELEDRLSACSVPGHALIRGEAHTAGLLNQNRDIYNRFVKDRGSEVISKNFTKDDEYYYFEFREILDDIPFCNGQWAESTFGESGGGSLPSIHAIYNKDGLIEFHAGSMVESGEAISTEPIIPPEQALKAYVDEYSKAIHFENSEIIGLELNYVIAADSKGLYARPAWVITTAIEKKAGQGDSTVDFDYTDYEVTAVSAYSGVILERETDMR